MTLFARLLCLMLFATSAGAALQKTTFTLTGTGGETGSGNFVWDDTGIPPGTTLNASSGSLPPSIVSISILVSGGNVVGGSTTFTRADCVGSVNQNTPNFAVDINFWCTKGANNLTGVAPFTNSLNGGASTLTFSAGTTAAFSPAAAPVPALSGGALGALAVLLLVGAWFTRRRRAVPIR